MEKTFVQIESITVDELSDLIVRKFISHVKAAPRDEHLESIELLTRLETAKLLKVNISTIHNWTRNKKLIAYGIGNRVYYKRDEVLKSLIVLN